LLPSAVGFTTDSETSTVVEERSELESSDDKTSDMGCKTDKKKQVTSQGSEYSN